MEQVIYTQHYSRRTIERQLEIDSSIYDSNDFNNHPGRKRYSHQIALVGQMNFHGFHATPHWHNWPPDKMQLKRAAARYTCDGPTQRKWQRKRPALLCTLGSRYRATKFQEVRIRKKENSAASPQTKTLH